MFGRLSFVVSYHRARTQNPFGYEIQLFRAIGAKLRRRSRTNRHTARLNTSEVEMSDFGTPHRERRPPVTDVADFHAGLTVELPDIWSIHQTRHLMCAFGGKAGIEWRCLNIRMAWNQELHSLRKSVGERVENY
jgi:hypothetical protein